MSTDPASSARFRVPAILPSVVLAEDTSPTPAEPAREPGPTLVLAEAPPIDLVAATVLVGGIGLAVVRRARV